MDGINIVGVQFRRAGRIYEFAAGECNFRIGDDVVVETDRGPSLAKVATVRFAFGGDAAKELKTITRLATRRDLDETRKLTPEDAVKYARSRAEQLGLKMTVLQSEVQFGGNKVIVYFSAPGRVDFRELVKELATGLKARVELKQVGSRDEAKLVGGIGICGREYCCSSFLREFVPVSIKMAKNQNLALNPNKVSGGCGRLLCCLAYENELYSELRRKLPPRGTRVRSLEDGQIGQVIKGDVLNQVLVIETAEGRLVTVPVAQTETIEAGALEAAEESAEAEAWGEDIDFAALAALGDEGEGGGKGEKQQARGNGERQRGDGRQRGGDRQQRKGAKPRGEGDNRQRRDGGREQRGPKGPQGGGPNKPNSGGKPGS